MRILMILVLLLPGGCHWLNQDPIVTSAPPPVKAPVQPVDITKLSDVLPDETHGGVAGAGLNRPGQTLAGLGDAARPGLWIETPLVQASGPGLVRLASGGAEIKVTLLPAPGPVTAPSHLSPAAMRRLGVPLDANVRLLVRSAR